MDLGSSRSTRYLPIVLILVIGLALVGLAMLAAPATQASPVSAPQATPTPGVNYQIGPYCVGISGGNSCTANDVTLASLTPSLAEACLSALPGETATIQFKAELQGTGQDRYDVGLFIATDGGDARTGLCYHDFLQPVTAGGPNDPPLNLTGGYGPFRQIDTIPNDICGDLKTTDVNAIYLTQIPVTVPCIDTTPQDGVVDDIGTCVSWDNNAVGVCVDVTGAIPGTGSKCRCERKPSGVLIYRGLDYGDLPNSYLTYKANSGPSHAVQDTNNDGTPDTIAGIPAVWLGSKIDLEGDGQPTVSADGDDLNGVPNDEDGVTPTLNSWTVGNPGNASVTVVVSTSTGNCAGCKLAWWMDWNNDGDFNDTGENYSAAVTAGSNPLNFAVPSYVTNFNFSVYSRWRLYSPQAVIAYPTPAYTNLVTNGEVEDYLWNLQPLGVTLANFSAMCTGGQPEISWETVSELNTLGFNVWRNTSNSGPQDKLNDTMIPAHPGSAQGYTYSFTDTTAQQNTTYYYWLEDISTGNVSSFNGPIDIQCQVPTSVGMDTVEASPAAGLPLAALPAAGLLAMGAAAVWLRRRRAS